MGKPHELAFFLRSSSALASVLVGVHLKEADRPTSEIVQQGRQCSENVTSRRCRATIVVVEN
jgi:hypothetical protein